MKYAIKILKQELKELKAEIKSDEDYISDVPEDEKHLYKRYNAEVQIYY